MKRFSLALLCSLPLLFAGCSSMAGGSSPQEIVASVAAANAGCTRLTLHCMQDGAATCCASTDQARVGKTSDPEDVKAMSTGETVVKDENGGYDVTVPILMTDGKWTTVCGVTMAAGMEREQAVEAAKSIAMAVKTSLGDCCPNGCK